MLQPIMQIALTVFMGRDIDGKKGGKQEDFAEGAGVQVGKEAGPRLKAGEDSLLD